MQQMNQQLAQLKRETSGHSVRLDLQADRSAGVWVKHAYDTKHILEDEDVESELKRWMTTGSRKRRQVMLSRTALHMAPQPSVSHGSVVDRVLVISDNATHFLHHHFENQSTGMRRVQIKASVSMSFRLEGRQENSLL